MENGEQPAYPHDVIMETEFGTGRSTHSGMSKREVFAMAAMQGLLANPDYSNVDNESVCIRAVKQADELLKALSNKQPK